VYVEGQKFIDNRDELRVFYNSVADQHNIKYLDYSLHNICNKREYFYNATHLNSRGANAFSSILAKDIKPLIAN
jgi:lysophospholipase L1-like esterase